MRPFWLRSPAPPRSTSIRLWLSRVTFSRRAADAPERLPLSEPAAPPKGTPAPPRPALSATPRIAAVYRTPAQYRAGDQGLVILDRFIPAERPAADSIWIDPPAQGSPIPVRKSVDQAAFQGWVAGHPATAGL